MATSARFAESEVENAALDWLGAVGWRVAYGPDIAPDMLAGERHDHGEVALARQLRDAVLPNLNSRSARPRLQAVASTGGIMALKRL